MIITGESDMDLNSSLSIDNKDTSRSDIETHDCDMKPGLGEGSHLIGSVPDW